MNFLSTPLPTVVGSEEQFVKRKPHPSTWLKGIKQSKEHIAARTRKQTKHKWGGKTALEWATILNGDYWTVITHIQNGTMEKYGTYIEWKTGFHPKRNQNRVIKFMTPIGVMTYAEAKEAFGFKNAEAIRNRLRSDKPEYADWYFLKESQL